MLSCFGRGSSQDDDPERQPLLPKYNDDTAREARLHEKLHTYQMLRAFSKAYLPSNKQTIVHLRTLLSSGILNPSRPTTLSPSGRALTRTVKQFIEQVIVLLQNKNSNNQLQDFIWYLRKANVDIDTSAVRDTVVKGKGKADAAATVESLHTIFSIAMLNKDFRTFVADLGTITRQVVRDTTEAIGDASHDASKQLEEGSRDMESLKATDKQQKDVYKSEGDMKDKALEVAGEARERANSVAQEVQSSVEEHTGDDTRQILIARLKKAVTGLRKRPDYSESVSTLANVLKRYLKIYLAVGADAANTIEENVGTNENAGDAAQEFWQFLTQFGEKEKWEAVKTSFEKVVEQNESSEDLDGLVDQFANTVQQCLSDPEFFDDIENKLKEFGQEVNDVSKETGLGDEFRNLMSCVYDAVCSALDDRDINNLKETAWRLIQICFPANESLNSDLISDATSTFVPLLIQAVQYVPIPRLEVSTPAIDLLLENLVLEPGKTVNNSSFLPFRTHLQAVNGVDITKAQFGTRANVSSVLNIKIAGMTIAAEDMGYWMKLHSGIFRLLDEGLGSFSLDERGIDITLDVELGRDQLEHLVSLRNVDVKIHKLNYSLSKSKFACLAWLFKPILRPIIRKSLESKISSSIGDGLAFVNRELVFARERLRASRICGPGDLWTFMRAVSARFVPADDPDVSTRVGIQPGEGVFRGRYAPGSLVKLWEEEAREADQNVFEYRRDGWHNAIFDVRTEPME